MPNALPRSLDVVNVVVSSDSADGTRMAPNAPWQARAITSMVKLTEAPPTADTPAKPSRPIRNVTLRPIRSASRPPSRSRLPNARVYAVTTHCRSTVVKCSARWADGSAMFITVTSRTTMSCASPITARMSQRRRSPAATLPMELTSDMSFTNLEVPSPLRSKVARSGGYVSTFFRRFQVAGHPAGSADEAQGIRPLRRDAERNRQRILKAASEVFNERGLEVSLDEIARHAGVGVGTVYRRFRAKGGTVGAPFIGRLPMVAARARD